MQKRLFFPLVFLFIIQWSLQAQRNWEEIAIEPTKITDQVFMLTGSGGNIGVLLGEDGTYIIDDQYAPLSDKILEAIKSLGGDAPTFVLNTHWHGDHTGGNENMAASGATIVAHKNVRERMSTKQDRGNGRTVDPSPESALPVITFEEDLTLYANGEQLLFFHVHEAHTDGDAIVYFTKNNVIHMGDTYFNGRYPYIDLYSGGTVNGIIEAANRVLFLANKDTKIIPGHGALSNKKELTAYRDMIMEVRDRVQQAIDAEMTFEEIQSANLTKNYDDEWTSGFIDGKRIVDIIYTDLTRVEKE